VLTAVALVLSVSLMLLFSTVMFSKELLMLVVPYMIVEYNL